MAFDSCNVPQQAVMFEGVDRAGDVAKLRSTASAYTNYAKIL